MSAPNHVIGGVVFTGIFCAFWNINIFASPAYLSITVFASLLPDIDHTRSTIGKIFLPLAKYLDRNFGHRTITHSLIFVITTWLVVYLFSAFTFSDMNIPMVFIFSISSHLIYDMMTVQGIPLFYPFKRNPCVIPGNPEHRLPGTLSSEFVVFGIFSLLIFFCIPLFKNGFWMTYNTKFNTLMHLNRIYSSDEKLLRVRYSYSENSNPIIGEGLLLYSEEGLAVIWDSTRILQIGGKALIKNLQPAKTNLKKEYVTLDFVNIPIDSLNRLLKDQIIVSGEIIGDHPFNITVNNKIETTTSLKLKWSYNDCITELENPEIDKIKFKEFELHNAIADYQKAQSEYQILTARKDSLTSVLAKSTSDYTSEDLMHKLDDLEKDIKKVKLNGSKIKILQKEIRFLKETATTNLSFSGRITKILIYSAPNLRETRPTSSRETGTTFPLPIIGRLARLLDGGQGWVLCIFPLPGFVPRQTLLMEGGHRCISCIFKKKLYI